MPDTYPNLIFYDKNYGELKLEKWGDKLWLFYKHPDGQWVSLRIATEADLVVLQVSRG